MSGPDILIVDDDLSIRDALTRYLARHGFTVRAAEGAKDCDLLLADSTPDLVILDVMLPESWP